MEPGELKIHKRPKLNRPRLLLGFSGWMDGGNVSTGTAKYLIDRLGAEEFAQIDPEGFYIHNFPGSMEITALFRPHARIEDGLITAFEPASASFFCSEQEDLIMFLGKEPHLQWRRFADCIFSLCAQFNVHMIYFIGSVAGLVPHTREPWIFVSVSDVNLKNTFKQHGVKFSNYEGPASIVTYLTARAPRQGVAMASLVATIPAYVQGNNPRCIEAATRRLAGILGLHLDLDDLRDSGDEFEKRLTAVVDKEPELARIVLKLEEDYDNEVFDSEMGDLKDWLQQKGVRLD